MKSILVLGAGGQVGRALTNALGDRAIPLDRSMVDLSNPDLLPMMLSLYNPSAIINAAAYTAVDKAEEEEEVANLINGDSPGVLAGLCSHLNIPFIHYSTDYVFPGTGSKPWTESDQTAPLSAYGRSKLRGEEKIAKAGGQYFIFRTSWVYDAEGKNFFNTMLRLATERSELRVVNDQMGAPSYAPHLAAATVKALENPSAPPGIYHMCNAGATSWHGFAEAIVSKADRAGIAIQAKKITGIPTSDYPTPARRPANSRLDCSKLRKAFNITLPDWWDGLNTCMETRLAQARAVA